jgi:hypothetical protein
MSNFAFLVRSFGALSVTGLLAAAFPCAAAETSTPSATGSGAPNFSGADFGWLAAGVDFLPPESGPGPVSDPPGHPHGSNNGGGQPSFRLADTTNPILQPWVRAALQKTNARIAAGGGGFTPQASCKPAGVPAFLLYPAQPVFFIQTPAEVLMVWQADHMVRHVYMNVPHSAHPEPSWFGESIGHYENGDTLVVDTTGLSDKTYVDNFHTPHTDRLHVVERFRLANAGRAIDVDVTVDDAGAFTTPWHARQHYRRAQEGPLLESACAESTGNFLHYDLDPIPQAGTPDF